jgi:glycerophosphoryl diester phosphodiesterase
MPRSIRAHLRLLAAIAAVLSTPLAVAQEPAPPLEGAPVPAYDGRGPQPTTEPPRLGDGYTIGYQRAEVTLHTRDRRPASQSGVRLAVDGQPAVDLSHRPGNSWLRHGATAGACRRGHCMAVFMSVSGSHVQGFAAAVVVLSSCFGCGRPGESVAFPGDESFALDCAGPTPHVAKVDKFVVVGHRGADSKAVENTLHSMDRAIADGATGVETDLSLTRDGVVVLWHDWDPDTLIALARQLGAEGHTMYRPSVPAIGNDKRRPVDELTLAELRAHYGYATQDGGKAVKAVIPTFQEFVDWAAAQKKLSYVLLDIKVPEKKVRLTDTLIRKMEAILHAAHPRFRYVYMSPYPAVWKAIGGRVQTDGLSFDVDPGLVGLDATDCDDASSHRALLRGGGYATTVHPAGFGHEDWKTFKTLLSCDVEARDTTRGSIPKVFAATVDQADKMQCLLDMGVDGVLTDDPALLARVAKTEGRR